MQVQIESILHRRTVDFRDEPARAHERRSINPGAAADFLQFMRGAARVGAFAAAHVEAQFMLNRRQTAFQRADDAGRDSRRMPIHTHDGAEGLKPKRMRETPQQFIAAVFMNDGFCDHPPQGGHPGRQPRRHMSAMQGEASAACALMHARLSLRRTLS